MFNRWFADVAALLSVAAFLVAFLVALLIAAAVSAEDAWAQDGVQEGNQKFPAKQRPNVLMIVVDDLNDWVEPLGGHPQAKTPAMTSLANRGVLFTNAHCQAPICNPSRTSVMLSLRPETTGIYGLQPWFRNLKKFQSAVSLPQHFAQSGYETYTCGKVYHNSQGRKPPQGCDPEFKHWGPRGGPGIMPKQKIIPPTPAGNNGWVDWGVFDHKDSEKGDWKVADWATKKIETMPEDKPFFMAAGFFLPHVPCYVTQKWWDMYPDEDLVMPPMVEDDLDDCPPFSHFLHWHLPEPRIDWLRKNKQHRNLVRAYLASITFCDSQVKRVLDALEKSPHADNTIVVLWSDHGFHLGEKEMSGKTTLWERSTRVPMIFTGPGIKKGVCEQPVELLDIYPTLANLAGLPAPSDVQGISLTPQLVDPKSPRARPAVTTHNPGNCAVRDQRYRYIQYGDGSEELYDLEDDPNEFTNVVQRSELSGVVKRLRGFAPKEYAPLAPGSADRILEQKAGRWYWENQPIDPENRPTK